MKIGNMWLHIFQRGEKKHVVLTLIHLGHPIVVLVRSTHMKNYRAKSTNTQQGKILKIYEKMM